MKSDLLDIIICPNCGSSDFGFAGEIADENEIKTGSLVCKSCSKRYAISGGIIHLYDKLSSEAEAEIKSIKSEISSINDGVSFQNDDWLLNYPNNEKLGIDQRSDRIMRLIAENSIRTIEQLKLSGKSILEIGAANCWLTARLAAHNNCVAMDTFTSWPKGLDCGDVFIRRNGQYFERVAADMANIPFGDKTFDIVLISSSLHHSSDLSQTLKGISRVLKEDGRVILINEPSTGWFGTQERLEVVKDIEGGVNEKRYSLADWKYAFVRAGLKYEIRLPENFIETVVFRGGIFMFIGKIFAKLPLKLRNLSLLLISKFVYIFFDGFFNAFLYKQKS